MTTITVVTACWGVEYAQFIPRWWDGLQSLNRKPDEIILGIDPGDPTGLSKSIPKGLKTKIVELPDAQFTNKWQYAISQATSKWWCFAAIDDVLLPNAFDEIEQADKEQADVYVDSILVKQTNRIAKGHWDFSNAATQLPVPGWPPITTEILKRVPIKTEYLYNDWIWQIDAYKAGIKPYFASTTRILWDRGDDRATISSDLNGQKSNELRKVYDYAKASGL